MSDDLSCSFKVQNYAWAILMDDSATGTQTYIGHLNEDDVVNLRPYELEGDLIGDGWTAFSGYEL